MDGIRLDTTPYMRHEFLKEVQDALALRGFGLGRCFGFKVFMVTFINHKGDKTLNRKPIHRRFRVLITRILNPTLDDHSHERGCGV